MCGSIVTVFQEHLEGDHHWVYEIYEVRVIFDLFRKNAARIDDARNVIDVNIFQLMAFLNHIFLEV